MTTKSAKTNGMTTKSAFRADFNRQDVITTLNNAFGKAMTWQSVPIDNAANFRKDADEANIEKALHIGDYPNRIAVYDIILKPNCHIARARVGIKNLVTQLMANYSYAILLFHYADAANKEWRISWVTRGGSSRQTNAAKRYTFLCGKMHLARTIVDRLSNINASNLADGITKAFSVEALSDEFFDEYKAFYEDIVQYICGARYVKGKGKDNNKYVRTQIEDEAIIAKRGLFAKFVEQAIKEKPELSKPIDATKTQEEQKKAKETQEKKQIEDAEKLVRNYVKKLLGRLVFIQFLAKKGWMGLKTTDAWGAGNEHFLHSIYDDYQKNSGNGNFVGDVLNKVLFYSLNNTTGMDGNVAICSNNIAGTNYKFPYLNGGLFEETDLDKLDITIPGYFFVSDNIAPNGREYADDDANAPKNTPRKFIETAKKKSKKKNGEESESANGYPYSDSEGLFEFFERYNFTIDENGSDEAVVGIDPEMLGKIFENLLEDNKDKGAFYTPKPVVEYMCQQSLITYLQNGVLKEKSKIGISEDAIKSQIEHFVKTKSLDIENSVESRQGLGEVGSETGIEKDSKGEKNATEKLDVLVEILNRLLKEVKICDPAIGSGAFPMGLLNELLECREVLALRLIDNSKGNAVFDDWGAKPTDEQREHLRARLKKEIIQNNIYGVDIEEGAIEIARLRFWLSIVIDLDKPEALPNFDYKFMQGNSLLESYQFEFEIENDNAVKKTKSVSIDLSGICKKGQVENVNNNGVAIQFEEGNKEREDLMALLRKYYGETDHEKKKILRGKIEKQVRVLLNAKCSQSYIKYINAMSLICDKFFLWHLWFKDVFDMGGFDIVIGNPPYFQMPKGVVDAKKYPYSEGKDPGKQNIYKLFIELAYNLLRETGVNSFITQSSLMCDASAQYTRELLLKNTTLYQVIEFPQEAPHKEGQLFKSASVATCIYLYAKMIPVDGHKFNLSDNNDLTTLYHFDFAEMLQTEPLLFYPKCYCFPLIRKMQFDIIVKMNKGSKQLITFIDESKKGDMCLQETDGYTKNKTPIPLYRGCNIHKYYVDDKVTEYIVKDYKQDIVQKNASSFYILCQNIHSMSGKRRIHASIKMASCLFCDSVNKLLLKPQYNIKMMLGILNFKPIDWYFRRTSTNNHINIYELEQLPIPTVSSAQQQEIITIVDKILSAKERNPSANTTPYERQIDALVYLLYDITSYDELLEIEGNPASALQMLILMHIHQNPYSTQSSIQTAYPTIPQSDIQSAISALVNEKEVLQNPTLSWA